MSLALATKGVVSPEALAVVETITVTVRTIDRIQATIKLG